MVLLMDFSRRQCKKSIVELWKSTTNYDITHTEFEQLFYKVMNNIKSCFYYRENKLGEQMLRSLIVLCFDMRNCRGGMDGWKDGSYCLFFKLLHLFPEIMITLLDQYSEFGYWKDYQKLFQISKYKMFEIDESTQNTILNQNEQKTLVLLNNSIIDLWIKQLKKDRKRYLKNDFDRISLCSKYIPKENKSLDKKYKVCKKIANKIFKKTKTSKKEFRKLCSNLNKIINNREMANDYTYNNEGKNMYIGQLLNLHDQNYTFKLLLKMVDNKLYKPIVQIINHKITKLNNNNQLYSRILNYKTKLPLQLKKTQSCNLKINKTVNTVIQDIVDKIETKQNKDVDNKNETEYVVISSDSELESSELFESSESSEEYVENKKNNGFLSSIVSWLF